MNASFKAALLAVTAMIPASAFAQGTAPAASTGAEENPAEIVVTARKFEEKLQNAPTTVAVATAAQIDNLGLQNVQDIAKTTPGLVFDESFGRDANRPVVRGQANILGQSGVAYFIDGIYYPGSIADFDVNSIERFEVVKGPQSALYGRNTYSGAINIITKSPGDHLQTEVTADISEKDRYELSGSVRAPIAEGLGVAINGRWYDNKGEFTNTYDGSRIGKQSSWSLSGMLKYDNGGPFRASLRANYNRVDDGQPAIFATSPNENNCFFDNGSIYRGKGRYFCGVIQPHAINTDYTRQFSDPQNVGLHADTFNAGLRMDFDFNDSLTLTSLTGLNRRVANNKTDGDYTGSSFQLAILAYTPSPASIPAGTAPRSRAVSILVPSVQDFTFSNQARQRDWSQELRLQFTSDRVKAILGGYYFNGHDDSYDTRDLPADALTRAQANANAAATALCTELYYCASITPPTITAASIPVSRNTNFVETENKAVFGALTFNFTNTLSLSAEGRYAEETITQVTSTVNVGGTAVAGTPAPKVYKKFTPRLTFDWQVTPNNLIYAIFAQGQKPGGFNSNTAIVAGVPTFDPEDNESYEIGFKNSFLGGRLIANLAMYHNLVNGYQITQTVTVPPNQVSVTRNGGNAEINGFELSIIARPSRNFTVTGNYAYTDAKFTFGTDENLGLLNDIADDGLQNCSLGKRDATLACSSTNMAYGSIVGKRIPRAPEHVAFVDVDYHGPKWDNGWQFFGGANLTMTSTSYDQVMNLASTGGSAVVDARLGFQNEHFKIQGYVRNLTDETSVLQIIRYADGANDLRRNFIAGLRPGRRFGVILQAKF